MQAAHSLGDDRMNEHERNQKLEYGAAIVKEKIGCTNAEDEQCGCEISSTVVVVAGQQHDQQGDSLCVSKFPGIIRSCGVWLQSYEGQRADGMSDQIKQLSFRVIPEKYGQSSQINGEEDNESGSPHSVYDGDMVVRICNEEPEQPQRHEHVDRRELTPQEAPSPGH